MYIYDLHVAAVKLPCKRNDFSKEYYKTRNMG